MDLVWDYLFSHKWPNILSEQSFMHECLMCHSTMHCIIQRTRRAWPHFHSAQSTWQGHCYSTCSRRASFPDCLVHRCCLQTQSASQWGPHSSPWPHDGGLSHEALLHSHWPLQVKQKQIWPRRELGAEINISLDFFIQHNLQKQSSLRKQNQDRLCCNLCKIFFKNPKAVITFFLLI